MKYWIMKDGTKIKISKMTNNHLINTLKMLDRNGYGYAHECFGSDMISGPCFECLMGPSDIFMFLEKELYHRGLDWKE